MDWTALLINFAPMLVVLAIFVYFILRLPLGNRLSRYQVENLEEIRRQNAILERIAAAVEKRTP